jgi:hypothetical protein
MCWIVLLSTRQIQDIHAWQGYHRIGWVLFSPTNQNAQVQAFDPTALDFAQVFQVICKGWK